MTSPPRTPLIGRTDELGTLSWLLAAAGAGTPGVALVSGEAGVGKTRLVAELAERAVGTGALVLSGAAVDVGESPPLLPLTLAVRAADPAVVAPWRAELEGLGVLPGQAPAAAHPLDAAGRVLLGLAATRTLVWIVEDVQWADRATRDLISYVAATMAGSRLLIVVTHRCGGGTPGLDELGLGGLRRHPRVHDLRLPPLDRDGVAAMVAAARLPEDPGDLVWRRSHGNAFIAEETLRALRDRDPGDPTAVPGTLRDLVLARVRALPVDARTVVRALSVAEPSASHELVALVTGLNGDRLIAAVRAAVEEGTVVVDPPGPEGGSEGYRLRHGLAVDVVAGDLLPAERRDLHRRHAAGIGELTADEGVAALLAHHWAHAGDARRALVATTGAAEAAERVHGYADAYRHWRHAADLVPEADRAPSLERAAQAAHLAGEHDAAVTAQLERLALGGGRPERTRLGEYLVEAGRGGEAERVYRDVLGESAPGSELAARAGHAEALRLAGRFAEARVEAERALGLARAAGEPVAEARVLVTLGYSLAYLEDSVAGAATLGEALRVAEESGAGTVLGRAYHGRAELLSGPLGAVSAGIEVALAGAARLTALGLGRTHGVRLLALAANGQFRSGRWDEAVAVVDRAFAQRPSGTEALDILLSRGRLRVGRGDLAGAAEDLDLVEMLAHDTAGTRYRVPLLTLRAGLAMFLGAPETAVAHSVAGLELTAGHDDVWLDAALVWHAVRAHAECVRLDRPPPAPATLALLGDYVAGLTPRSARAAPAVADTVRMFALMCEAEQTRAAGASDPHRWGALAELWTEREQPYNVAYGLLRRAEALLSQRTRNRVAADDLAQAATLCAGLGAAPLLAEVHDLARRARVTLPGAPTEIPAPVAPARPDRLAALTPREREVLAEIAAGLTNRQIAARLFISEKTVGIHVTHLFAKLGVRTRVQAGAVFLQAGRVVTPT